MKRTVEKRVLEAEEKVAKFPFFAERALTRTGKKWIGIQRQSLSAKLKTKSKTEKMVEQLEAYKALNPSALGDAAMRRLQIFSTTTVDDRKTDGRTASSPTPSLASTGQEKLVKAFLGSKLFEKESKNLIEARRKRTREVRHLKERMGRKDRRQAKVEENKLNPKRAPLPSQKDMYLDSLNSFDRKQKPKNRLGQRERKRRALEREREEALREKKVKPGNRKERRRLIQEGVLPRPEKRAKVEEGAGGEEEEGEQARTNGKAEKETEAADAHEHHASWALKRKREEEQKNATFTGKKMTFDDSGGESEYDDDSD